MAVKKEKPAQHIKISVFADKERLDIIAFQVVEESKLSSGDVDFEALSKEEHAAIDAKAAKLTGYINDERYPELNFTYAYSDEPLSV